VLDMSSPPAAARHDLALTAALEGRVAVIAGIGSLPLDVRAVALRAVLGLRCRPVVLIARPEDERALADLAVLIVRVPELSAGERAARGPRRRGPPECTASLTGSGWTWRASRRRLRSPGRTPS
jgi:hypothetical protein